MTGGVRSVACGFCAFAFGETLMCTTSYRCTVRSSTPRTRHERGVVRKIAKWLHFGWNWQGAIVGFVLLGLIVGDLALFGHTAAGYVGVGVIVVVSAVLLRFEIGPASLHR